MSRIFLLAAMLLFTGLAYSQEPYCPPQDNVIHYTPNGYECNGRRYFNWNYCFPGYDMHHGVEPGWPSRRPYYYSYWYYY